VLKRQEDKSGTDRKCGRGMKELWPEFKIQEGDIMRNSEILLILALMFISNSAHATLAICPACSGEQPDWTKSATSFLEGNSIQDTPSTLNGAQQASVSSDL